MGCTDCVAFPNVIPSVEVFFPAGFSSWNSSETGSVRRYKVLTVSASQIYNYKNEYTEPGGHTFSEVIHTEHSFGGTVVYNEDGTKEFYITGSGSASHTLSDSADPSGDFEKHGTGSYLSADPSESPDWSWTGDTGAGMGTIEAVMLGRNPFSSRNILVDDSIYDLTTTPTNIHSEGTGTDDGSFSNYDISEYVNFDATLSELVKSSYVIDHNPTGSCYLRVDLNLVETTDGDSVSTPLPSYVWNPEGNPCLSEPNKAYNHPDNHVTADPVELDSPDADNTAQDVEIVSWSFLPDYEPTSDEPNGFPPPYSP